MKIDVPQTVNLGLPISELWDGSSVAISGGETDQTYRYETQIFVQNSVSTIVSAVGQADPSGLSDLKKVIVNVLSDAEPSAIYAVGGCYGKIINDKVYSVEFALPVAYRVGIKGSFYIKRNGTNVMEAWGVDTVKTVTGTFRITPELLNELGDFSDFSFDEFVFGGEIYLMPVDSESVSLPNIAYWYSDNDAYFAEVVNANIGSSIHQSYDYFRDPVVSYFYGSNYGNNSITGTIDITENGFYNVRDYGYANINVPQTLSWGSMFDWIFDSIGAFMSFEIAPGWSIGVLMSIAVSLAVGIWLMRLFMGG